MIEESLVLRTLQIPAEAWRATLADYARDRPPAPPGETLDGEIARCLGALSVAYLRRSPHATAPPQPAPARGCPACGRIDVRPWLARAGAHALVYGRCASCGHGLLQDGLEAASDAAIRARHASPDYFHTRDGEGAGYDAYAEEASYREAKGTKLVARLAARARGPLATLLEVGSGFGYTRAAAERAGVRTAGVDVNPHAGAEAKRRYGLATFHGTLEEALGAAAPAIAPGGFDAVLYQFVLEHVRDPVRELGAARRALRPGGQLALLVPSMAAAEIDVFGASYRSFRGDHRHLYTRASLGATLARVGLHLSVCESHCNIHLFRDLLSPSALERLYATGRGPDLWVIAEAST